MSRAVVSAPPTSTLPALIFGAGNAVRCRFLEFFTVNIRNPNTCAAYSRAAGDFLRWCEDHGSRELYQLQPVHVAAYIKHLGRERSSAGLGYAFQSELMWCLGRPKAR